jgi:hypothetical protein
LPPNTPTTTLPTSSALCRNAPVSMTTSWFSAGQAAGGELAVRLLQHRDEAGGLKIAGGEFRRIKQHAHLALREPPMSVVSATSGTCFTASSTWARGGAA